MEQRPRTLTILSYISVALMGVATWMALFYAPLEATMGEVYRIFYFHVPTWWVGMLGLIVAGVSGIAYLVTGNRKWDVVELSAVEISVIFGIIGIVTGSIWARPAWNTWWTWDPRLTTVAIMELIYIAYLMLRAGIEDPDRRARFGAVYAIVGSVSVPITFLSIRLLRTIHPVVAGSSDPAAQGTFDMTPPMVQTLLFCLFAFSVIFVTLLWHRIRLGRLSERIEQLRLQTMV